MKFTVKNLKEAKFASEETMCFEATVYINGNKAFTASNDGHGASHNYHPLFKNGKPVPASQKLLQDAYAWVKAQPEITEKAEWHENGEYTYQPDLDHYIDEAIFDYQLAGDFKKTMKKATFCSSGKLYNYNCAPDHPKWREAAKKAKPDAIILNDLPLDEAFDYYKKAMGA